MKVLIVCSATKGYFAPFIQEQIDSLVQAGIDIILFQIKKPGLIGYLSCFWPLVKLIKETKPHVIHAHYGLSGLLAVLQRKVPVVITYHGSDINIRKSLLFSKVAMSLAQNNIFVSKQLQSKGRCDKSIVIPCGVNMNVFKPMDKNLARQKLSLSLQRKYILFSSSFDNTVKNYLLAKTAVDKLNSVNVELVELKGYKREEVALLMNAVDVAILTSFSEGSPQFIKEAMACNLPIVATNVGDIKEVIGDTDGCYVAMFDSEDIKEKLEKALAFNERTQGKDRIRSLDNNIIANRIINVYKAIRYDTE